MTDLKTNQQILDEQVPEAELQTNIIKLATLLGYEHYHTLNSRGSDPGALDLELIKVNENPYAIEELGFSPTDIIYFEIKREGQSPTDEQFFVLEAHRLAGHKVYVIWPSDFSSGFVEKILKGE